jgi:polyisoprenoid-binding protein YceI
MKIKQLMVSSAILATLTLATGWNVDTANAKITFTVKGPFGTVHGNFTGLKAVIKFDEKDLAASSISASIDAKTVSTGIGMRNHDLRSKEEWLNTDKFPEISFRSKKIEKTEKGYKAIGDLTLKGISKPLEIPFTFSNKGSSGLFQGQFIINREDFAVGKKGGTVGSTINISLEVPVKK